MSNQKIFCNVPWTNTHIYWDGSYGMCCSERIKPSQDPTHNVKNINIVEWYTSDVMKGLRSQIKQDTQLPNCQSCYREEQYGSESRRIKENFKSAIFTEQAFEKSYQQSPWFDRFNRDIQDDEMPIDWHVDLGNECNLACKMCNPDASSKIATQYKKWKIFDGPILNNWMHDEPAWDRFLKDIVSIPKLNRVHFMGGEPTINKRLTEFLQFMVANARTGVSISFVTNGTRVNSELIELLKNFKTFDIELSIESIGNNNAYIRQGSNTSDIIENILYLKDKQSEQFHLVLRTAPQLLSINTYHELIRWAYDNELPIQSIPLSGPRHYQISVLPKEIRNQLLPKYYELLEFLQSKNTQPAGIATGRMIGANALQLSREVNAMIHMLNADEPPDAEALRHVLIADMKRWDTIYGLDACEIYPEYREFFKSYGY